MKTESVELSVVAVAVEASSFLPQELTLNQIRRTSRSLFIFTFNQLIVEKHLLSNTHYVLAQYAISICSVTQKGGNCLGKYLLNEIEDCLLSVTIRTFYGITTFSKLSD